MRLLVLMVVGGLLLPNALLADVPKSCVIAFNGDEQLARIRAKRVLANRVGKPMTDEIARHSLEAREYIRIASQTDLTNVTVGRVTRLDGRSFALTTREGNVHQLTFDSSVVFLDFATEAERGQKVERLALLQDPETRALIERVLRAQTEQQVVEVSFQFPVADGQTLIHFWSGKVQRVDTREVWEEDPDGYLNFPDQISIWLDRPLTRYERYSKSGRFLDQKDYKFRGSYAINLTGREAIKPEQFKVLP